MSERIGAINRPLKRKVAIRHDGEDFVISFLPEDTVVFRQRGSKRAEKSLCFTSMGSCQRHHCRPKQPGLLVSVAPQALTLMGMTSPCSVATNLEATPATPEFVAGSLASTGVA